MPITVLTIGRAKVRVSEVNAAAKNDKTALFNRCNEKYEKKIEKIAMNIAEDPSKARLIMLSGPSASGKTTTSLKLQNYLRQRGVGAVAISLDDYFRNREDAPILPDGTRDFESSASLDTDLIKSTLCELITTGSTELPVFNFKTGHRLKDRRPVTLGKDDVAIVEGLHALNPDITGLLPEGALLKLYVSVSSDFILDTGDVLLSARDVRLIRRTVRDHNFRGTNVDTTLSMWDAVCRGEDMYVRPYKRCADFTINSAFNCEPCIFKQTAIELFSSADKDSPFKERIKHIIDGLNEFEPISPSIMPSSCVLREFTGGSEYYGHGN